jgi:hypothetical protein
VKRLLRHIQTGKWVSSNGTFSPDVRDAFETETLSDAIQFCSEHNLTGVEIVLRFGDPRFDSTIYVSDTLMIKRTPEKT